MGNGMVLHSHLPYDRADKDFVSVALFGVQPNVLVASKQSGFKTVADLVAAAKAKPGTLTFASAGVGSPSHMAGEKFRLAAKIDVRHVPFQRQRPDRSDGRTHRLLFHSAGGGGLGARSGKLEVLAVSSAKRVPLLPDVPSIAEAGYPGAEFNFWVGLSAPAKTPRDIVNKLHDATEKALANPDMTAKLAKLGVDPEQMSARRNSANSSKTTIAATVQLAKAADIKPVD